MSNRQEFIYKGYGGGHANERGVHMLKKAREKDLYYLFKVDRDLEIGQRVLVNYNHAMPYRKGILLVGGQHLWTAKSNGFKREKPM